MKRNVVYDRDGPLNSEGERVLLVASSFFLSFLTQNSRRSGELNSNPSIV